MYPGQRCYKHTTQSIFNDAAIGGDTGAVAAEHWVTENIENKQTKNKQLASGDKLTLLKMIRIQKGLCFTAKSTSGTKTV